MVVEMSSFKLPHLPPSMQRFRCGGEEVDVSSDVNHQHSQERSRAAYASSGSAAAAASGNPANGTERVRAFVHGMVSPFTSCLQPSVTSCVAGGASCVSGCGPDYSTAFHKKPAVVVSPLADRQVQAVSHAAYRDSRSSPMAAEESAARHQGSKLASPPRIGVEPAMMHTSNRNLSSADIEKPHASDVLCGRGGSSNRHLGNIHFRELVAANKRVYVGLTKKQKMMVARNIVEAVKGTDPPGRFLAKDSDTGLYYDIGLPRSLEKTSQALREKNSNESPKEPEEGIETSVESFQSVVNQGKDGETTTETQQNAGESPESAPPKKPTKSSKNIEAPPLVIPAHLMEVFGPKKRSGRELAPRELSPNDARYMDPHYRGGPPPYHPAYGPHGAPPTPTGAYSSHQGTCPPPPRHPAYPPASPPGAYREHGRYYYPPHHQHPPRTPPYGRYAHPADGHRRHYYRHSPDHREAYNEYYSRTADRESPQRADGQGRPPPPPPTRYPVHGYPPAHPLAHQLPYHGHPGAPPPPPHPHSGAPLSPPAYRPSQYGHPPTGYHHPDAPPLPPRDGSSQVIYRTPSNGYVRGQSEISPERQREFKRQRNADGHIRRVSESSLSSAVQHRLTLDERVVGRERQPSVASSIASSSASAASSGSDLISPSSILQSRSRRSTDDKDKRASLKSDEKKDYSSLSGLAALSTAAFLKLDEDN